MIWKITAWATELPILHLGRAMTDYRRAKFCGGYYFFTLITHDRRGFLVTDLGRRCLRKAWQSVSDKHPFEIIAVCLLPEHLHCVLKLPEGDNDYSLRWQLIKKAFTRNYLSEGGVEYAQSASRVRKRERGVWQRRFWEHQIRDETDLQNHVDYIHYNPVKHGLVGDVEDWPWSTYHRFIRSGFYGEEGLKRREDDFGGISGGE